MFKILRNEETGEFVVIETIKAPRSINPKAKRKADEVIIYKTKDERAIKRLIARKEKERINEL